MAFSPRRLRSAAFISALVVLGLYWLSRASVESSISYQPLSLPKNDGRVYWTQRNPDYPVTSLKPLPKGKKVAIPKIQAEAKSEDSAAKTVRLDRQAAVKESFVHSWEGYRKNAWLRDEVAPVTGGFKDTFGGWAATLVDALDTLWIMGLKEEFEEAVNAVREIDFTTTETKEINVFETTIRYLGGFLAAYDISGAKYPLLLTKAVEVGELLMGCFDTPNRMPITRWDWISYIENNKQQAHTGMIVSELGSLSIEFTRLSQLTGDLRYYDAIQRISDVLEEHQNKTRLPGMWPVVVDARTPSMISGVDFHIGGMIDSLYEYLPKQFMMLGGHLAQPQNMYEKFIAVAKKYIFFSVLNPRNEKLLISGEVKVTSGSEPVLHPNGQHLGCFTGGMVAIASKIFNNPGDLEIARQLTEGCVWAYDSQNTGIAPEIFTLTNCDDSCTWSEEKWHARVRAHHYLETDTEQTWEEKVINTIEAKHLAPGFAHVRDARYILRPEAIESVFIMYRITGDVEWQNKAWRMFEHIKHFTMTPIAFSAIDDVTADEPKKMNSMESFWLAETLKYFYLIFSDMDLVSLDEYVLNTEAHPLSRPKN